MVGLKSSFTIVVGVAITLVAAQPLSGQLRGTSSQQLAEEVSTEYLIKAEVNDKKVVEVTTDEVTAPNKETIAMPITKSNPETLGSDPHDLEPYEPGPGTLIAANAGIISVVFLLEMCCFCGFAFLYKQKVVDRIPPLNPAPLGGALATDFKYGIFSCFEDTNTCLHACFCSPCRVAHNTQVTGVMDYWVTIVVMFLSGIGAQCCVPQCLLTYYRMEIKKKVGVNPEAVMDCICSACCGCCSIAQAAREVDEKCGVRVACCCDMQQLPGQQQMPQGTSASELSNRT